jgi:uncharacterized membrane protein YedE/YeeE
MDAIFPNGITHYLAGGLLIGCGTALLFVLTGRIGGMSTVFSATWSWFSDRPFFRQPRFLGSRAWRLAYAAGLIVGAGFFTYVFAGGERFVTAVPGWQLALGGFLVGFGARMSNGCTSGHGICGLASLKLPSLAAVITFMATAFLVANVVALFGGR